MVILNPHFLWFLLVIPLLILLYLLAPRGKRVQVSSLRFWPESLHKRGTQFRWREFSANKHLYLQVLALLLLIAALIGPLLRVHTNPSPASVFIFDASASMKALENGEGRMDRVRREALRMLDQKKEGSIILIRAGVKPEILHAGSFQEKGRVAEIIRSLQADDGSAHLLTAVETAYNKVGKGSEIVLFTDGASPETGSVYRHYPAVRIKTVGKESRNVSISSLERSEYGSGVTVQIKNHGEGLEQFDLDLLLEAKEIGTQKMVLGPYETASAYFHLPAQAESKDVLSTRSDDRVIEARISLKDGLLSDNQARMVWSNPGHVSILLVTTGNRPLARALKARREWDVAEMTPRQYEAALVTARGFDVVFFDHYRPPDISLHTPFSASPERQGRFLIAPPPEGGGKGVYRDEDEVRVVDWKSDHPVMRFIEPAYLRIQRASVFDPPPWAEVLMRGDHPLITAESGPSGRTLVMGFDPAESDLPRTPYFPIFLMNAIQWLKGGGERGYLHAGEVYTLKPPPSFDGEGLWVTPPDRERRWVAVKDGWSWYEDTAGAGVYQIEGSGRAGSFKKRFAVNVEPGESSIKRLPFSVKPDDAREITEKREAAGWVPLWRFLAIGAAGIMIFEWAVRKERRGYVLRGTILLLLILALSGIRFGDSRFGWGKGVCTLFVMDYSGSISPGAREYARRLIDKYITGMSDEDQAGLVVFGRDPVVGWSPRSDIARPLDFQIRSQPDDSATDISGAVQFASSLFPEGYDKRIVLLSDGHETVNPNGLEDIAIRASMDGVTIHAVPLGGENIPGLRLANLHLPESVQRGISFPIQVILEGEGEGDLRVYRNGTLNHVRTVQKKDPASEVLTIASLEEMPGYSDYEIELLSGAEPYNTLQRRGGSVRIEGPLQVLYVMRSDSDIADSRPLFADIIRSQGIPVEVITPERLDPALRADPMSWSRYGLIVMDDVPATEISLRLRTLLHDYVHDLGGGLLMIGEEGGFGPGGYGGSEIERLLPVSMDIPSGSQAEGMELVLLLDKSGSMDERVETKAKWKSAIRAVTATLKELHQGDALGIIAFDTQAHDIVSLRREIDPDLVRHRLEDIVPGGGTDIRAALEMSLGWFHGKGHGHGKDAHAGPLRHLVILSDGKTRKFDLPAMVERLKELDVSVSAMGIGDVQDHAILKDLAAATGGRFYKIEEGEVSPEKLSGIFQREAVLASKEWVVTEPFVPRLKDPRDGLEESLRPYVKTFPAWSGYVRTSPKKMASVLLESDHGDPLMAVWDYGAGRAAAFTSDGSGVGTSAWLRWPLFHGFVGNLVRWTMRPQAMDPLIRHQIATNKGMFQERLKEETGSPPDYPRLKRVADITGGRFLTHGDNPFAREKGQQGDSGEIWPLYLLGILLIYMIDIVLYRGIYNLFDLRWLRIQRLLRKEMT